MQDQPRKSRHRTTERPLYTDHVGEKQLYGNTSTPFIRFYWTADWTGNQGRPRFYPTRSQAAPSALRLALYAIRPPGSNRVVDNRQEMDATRAQGMNSSRPGWLLSPMCAILPPFTRWQATATLVIFRFTELLSGFAVTAEWLHSMGFRLHPASQHNRKPESMHNTIVLIEHHNNPRDDAINTYLPELGFETRLKCPFQGERLGDPDADLAGCVVYGGAQNVTQIDEYRFLHDEIAWIQACIAKRIPLLGICLGAQLIAAALGARVGPHPQGRCEFGCYPVQPTPAASGWMEQPMYLTQAHFQEFDLPDGATLLATGDRHFPNQAFKYGELVYAVQFHPEVTPAVFTRWQNSDWAMYAHPGAQARQQQTQLMQQHGERQTDWVKNFLRQFFGQAKMAIQHQLGGLHTVR